MKRSAWWFGIAMLAGVSLAHGQDAQFHPPLSADMVERAEARIDGGPAASTKNYGYHGALKFYGDGGYEFNTSGTVRQFVDRLQNDSTTLISGSIRIKLFLTQAPIVPGQGFTYWVLARDQLSPLLPLNYYSNYDATVPSLAYQLPDGIYYIYLGAWEYENNCGSSSGYCLDYYYGFPGQVEVSGGDVYNYTPVDTTTAVEYYHAGFGHYFTTAQADEITGLDGGAYGGVWTRTGYTFGVWTSGTGLFDVCRFFQVY